jgi:hypothetical protein
VRIRSSVVVPRDPSVVTVKAPRRRLRKVRYLLDGRKVRDARRSPFRLALKPRQLSKRSKHVLMVQVTPRRGRKRTMSLRFRTLRCDAVLTAAQKRTRTGSWLMLRIDSVKALRQITFKAPGRMLPKPLRRKRVGRLRVHFKGGKPKTYQLAYGKKTRGGAVLAKSGSPRVVVKRGTVIVSGLPALTGIVKLKLYTQRRTRPKALVQPGRSAKLSAQARTTSTRHRLSYKLLGPRRRSR